MAIFEVKFKNAPPAVVFAKSKANVGEKIERLSFVKGFKPKIKTIEKV